MVPSPLEARQILVCVGENYGIKHGAGHFFKDLGNGDVDTLSMVHEAGMALNSNFLGIACPPASATLLTGVDYTVDYCIAPINTTKQGISSCKRALPRREPVKHKGSRMEAPLRRRHGIG